MNQFKNDKFFIGHVDDEKNSQQVEKNVNEKEWYEKNGMKITVMG